MNRKAQPVPIKSSNRQPHRNIWPSDHSQLLRPLGADIFNAFAFSDAEGTSFLDRLQAGANTMQELGINIWELWHEDKRDSFFFFESQPELKRFTDCFAPHGRDIHVRFEAWVVSVMKQYEARVSSRSKVKNKEIECAEKGVYWRLLTHKSPITKQPLSWNERASEIMDHIGAPGFRRYTISSPSIDTRPISHCLNQMHQLRVSHYNIGAGHDRVPCTLELLMQK